MILMIIELVSSGESHSGGKRDSQAVGAKHLLTTTEVNAGNTDKDHVNSVIADPTKTTTTVTKEVESSEFQGSTESIEINSGTQKETIKIKSWEDFEYKNVWVLEGGQKVVRAYSWYLEQIKNNVTVILIINGKLVPKDPEVIKTEAIKRTTTQTTCIENYNLTFRFEDDAHLVETNPPGFDEKLTPSMSFEQVISGYASMLNLKNLNTINQVEFNKYAEYSLEADYSSVTKSYLVERDHSFAQLVSMMNLQFENEISYNQAEHIADEITEGTTTQLFSLTRARSWMINDARAMNSIDIILSKPYNDKYLQVFMFSSNLFADLKVSLSQQVFSQSKIKEIQNIIRDYLKAELYRQLRKEMGTG